MATKKGLLIACTVKPMVLICFGPLLDEDELLPQAERIILLSRATMPTINRYFLIMIFSFE
jgi:hypothetical protein